MAGLDAAEVLTGETIGAAEALVWGLVEKICALVDLDLEVNRTLDAILATLVEPSAVAAGPATR